MEKLFLDEATIIEDSFRLGAQVFESGLRPTFIVGLWRGGSSVGIYVQECLQTLGVETDHISLRTSYRGLPDYQNMIEAPDSIRVHGTRYLIDNLNAEDSLLIVDDAFSSGHSIDAVVTQVFLHGDTYRGSASPYGDHECGAKSAVQHFCCELPGIF